MQEWVELEIFADSDAFEIAIAFLEDLGFTGFVESENSLKGYIKESDWDEGKLARIEKFFENLRGSGVVKKFSIVINRIKEQDWNEIWERSIEPIEVGKKFVIKPTWKEYTGDKSRIIIEIDPKMSFGTGYHETTRLMLKAIEKYVSKDLKVLDVGTGTGILAIASLKLGASKAIGVDNDEWSFINANENAVINNVAKKFTVIYGTIESVGEKDFDIILANINKNAIVGMAEQLVDLLKDGGYLVVSGFLNADANEVEEKLLHLGLTIIEMLCENEWIAIVAKK